jgi:hypothetical protein
MNASRTKQLKRTNLIDLLSRSLQNEKRQRRKHSYQEGILNDGFAALLGKLTAYWPHVEERMICVMRDLIAGHAQVPARQIFRSVISEAARIKIMAALLERSPSNSTKGKFYDHVIFSFRTLNSKRNAMVHGLWWTRDDGKMFMARKSLDEYSSDKGREVPASEVHAALKKMVMLVKRLKLHEQKLDHRWMREKLLNTPEARAEYRKMIARNRLKQLEATTVDLES